MVATSSVAFEGGNCSCFFLPRMFLSRKPRGGLSCENLTRRFSLFSQGRWTELIRASERDAEEAATARRRRRRRGVDDLERRAARAQMMVQLGELSAGRQALEAAEIAPGTLPTLQALSRPDTLLVLVKTSRRSCSSSSQSPHWSWMKGHSQRICVLRERARQQDRRG